MKKEMKTGIVFLMLIVIVSLAVVSAQTSESYLLRVTSITEDTSIGKNYTTLTNVVTGQVIAQYITTGDNIHLGNIVLTIGTINKNEKTVELIIPSLNRNTTFVGKLGSSIIYDRDTDDYFTASYYSGTQTQTSSCSPITNTCTINLNEQVTTTFSGGNYSIKLTFIDSTYAQFIINNNNITTTKLVKGGTYKVDDVLTIKVEDIVYQNFVGGEMYAVISLSQTPAQSCIDSDALNYYLKGNVKGIATCEDTFRVDECYSSKTKLTGGSGDYVFEAICGGNCPAGQLVYCSYGCRSGACLKSTMGLASTRPGIIGWFKNLFS